MHSQTCAELLHRKLQTSIASARGAWRNVRHRPTGAAPLPPESLGRPAKYSPGGGRERRTMSHRRAVRCDSRHLPRVWVTGCKLLSIHEKEEESEK